MLVGIVSWVKIDGGTEGIPGFYGRLSHALKSIYSHIPERNGAVDAGTAAVLAAQAALLTTAAVDAVMAPSAATAGLAGEYQQQ